MKPRNFYTLFFILTIIVSPVLAQQTTVAPKTVAGGVVNSKAVNLPKPEYPAAARAIAANGAVNVQVTIDEQGDVVSATAVSGHPLLRAASEKAALEAKFTPTYLSGKAVKVTGIIVYNFVAPEIKPDYEETLRTIALGVMLFSYQELGVSDEDLNSMLTQIPTYYPELKSFAPAKNASREQRVKLINQMISTLKSSLSGTEAWQFELGENLGKIMAEAKKYKSDDSDYKIDTAALKINLEKIRELSDSAPADMPAEVLEKIKDLGSLAAKNDLDGEELLAVMAVKMKKLIYTISPD
ncbi:MAG TPA: energy transducer TonB [Pyrinomonadaceae bacterium]|jgi:hypothetical protein